MPVKPMGYEGKVSGTLDSSATQGLTTSSGGVLGGPDVKTSVVSASYSSMAYYINNEQAGNKSFRALPTALVNIALSDNTLIDFNTYKNGVMCVSGKGVFGIDSSWNFTRLSTTATLNYTFNVIETLGAGKYVKNVFFLQESTFTTTATSGVMPFSTLGRYGVFTAWLKD